MKKILTVIFFAAAICLATPDKVEKSGEPVRGQRIFTCAHSFHGFVPAILADIAASAGIKDHKQVGSSGIGGSWVIQHWDVPDEKNDAKRLLTEGDVDVLTLSPIWLPDAGIEKFGALADPRIWLLIALYFSVAVGTNVTGSYLPKLIKDSFEPLLAGSDGTYWKVGLLSTLPSILSVMAMVIVSRVSDRTRSRATLIAGALTAAAVGWYYAWQGGDPWTKLAGLCVAQAGMMAVLPVFWALPPLFLGGVAAAAGIALINSVANIGGIIAPSVVGNFGIGPLVAVMLWGVAMALIVWRKLEWPALRARKNLEHNSRG